MLARTTAGLLGVPAMIPHERETARLQAFSRFVSGVTPASSRARNTLGRHSRSLLQVPAVPACLSNEECFPRRRGGDSVDGKSAFVWPMWGSWHMGAQGADDGDEVGGARQSGRTVDVVESACGFGGSQPERESIQRSRWCVWRVRSEGSRKVFASRAAPWTPAKRATARSRASWRPS